MKKQVFVLALSLVLLAAGSASAFWYGLYSLTKYKVGATWLDQPVNFVNKPGSVYHGVAYLYNDPSKFMSPDPYQGGAMVEGFPVLALPPDCSTTGGQMPCWKQVMLPDPPPQDQCAGRPPRPGPFPAVCVVGWNTLNWPADASHQHANTTMGGGYALFRWANDFYDAPAGAPCIPMYRHLCR